MIQSTTVLYIMYIHRVEKIHCVPCNMVFIHEIKLLHFILNKNFGTI